MPHVCTHIEYLTQDRIDDLYLGSKPRHRALFYDGGVKTLLDWRKYLKDTQAWLLQIAREDGAVIGMGWLNGFQGRTAQCHFGFFEGVEFAEAVEACRDALGVVESVNHFHSVYGVTPTTHRHVIPVLTSVGFQIIGRVPGACYIARRDCYIEGIISVYTFRRDQK